MLHKNWNNITKFERFCYLILVKHDGTLPYTQEDNNKYKKLYQELKDALR